MTLEKLKKLLESGAISQEEYDEMAKSVKEPEPTTDPEPAPANEPEPQKEPVDYDKLERIIQARVDKLMASERKEKAELKQQLEKERKANLTEAELKQMEIEEKEKALEEREKALTERQNREYAQRALREAGLDDGSETAFALVDFVMGADETEIDEKVKSFKELFNKAVTAEVNKRFKENGRTPQKGTNLNGGKNPWTKEQWNITEQMAVEIQNPELAAQLKAAAGVK